MATGRIALAEFLLLLGATLVGTIMALMGIGALLSPIHALADTLRPDSPEAPVLPEVGDVIRTLYAGVHRAATSTRAQMDELQVAAHEDPLTGIANRRGLLAQIEELPIEKRQGCIAIIDIDHFKQVNDRYGHDAGDDVLREVGARLTRADRGFARLGGEEFAVLLPGATTNSALAVAERLRQAIENSRRPEVDAPVTASFGVTMLEQSDLGLADPLRRADEALYRSKGNGRNQVTCSWAMPAEIILGSMSRQSAL